MSHGIDASMQTIEPIVGHSRPDHLFGQPDLVKLPPTDYPMLSSRQPGDLSVKDLRV
jgi:hypothetical protein